MPGHRDEQRPGREQQRRDLELREFCQLPDPAQRRHRLGHVYLEELGDVRHGERARHHGRGHVLAHAADRDALLAAGDRGHGGRPGSVPGSGRTDSGVCGRRPLHVIPGDGAVRAAARQLGQADAEVLGQLAHRRLGQHASSGGDARLGGHLRRLDRYLGRGGHLGRFRAPGRGPACPPRGGRGLDPVTHQDRMRTSLVLRHALGGRSALSRYRGGYRSPFGAIGCPDLDRDDRDADVDGLALLGQQPGDRAVPRARQLDHRLGGLDLHDDLAVLDRLTRLDVPGDDVGLGQALAHVGQLEFPEHPSRPLSSRTRGRRRPGSGPGRAGSAPRSGTAGTGWRSRLPAAPAPRDGRSTAR